MLPSNPGNGLLDGNACHSQIEQLSDLLVRELARSVQLSGLSYYFSRENCAPLALYKLSASPPPFSHIFIILLFRAAVKMVGSHARRVVAVMENALPFWYWPVMECPREAVRRSVVKHTVAIVITSRSPNPTSVGFENIRPESPNLQACPTSCSAPRVANALGCTEKLAVQLSKAAYNAGLFVYDCFSQCMNLTDRFVLRLGSFGRRNLSFEPFAF